MGFLTFFLVFGCFPAIYTRLSTLPPHCAAMLCPQPRCMNPITPRGQCCPICPGTRNKPGRCPPVRLGMVGICVEECTSDYGCPGREKCCSNGCGHVCTRPVNGDKPDCFLVDCPQLRCVNQYTPPGRCCPVCRPPGHIDCSLVPCASVSCIGQYTPQGQCCPVCPPTGY